MKGMRIMPEYGEYGEPIMASSENGDAMERIREENRAAAAARRREMTGHAALKISQLNDESRIAQVKNLTENVQQDSSPYFAD